MTLQEYNTAVRMRGIIEKIATRVVNRERPTDKVGRVVDIDRGSGTAWVVYAGDEETSLRVRMYPGRQPQASDRITGPGMGAIVRVSGPIGSRYIAEILSDAGHLDQPRLFQPRFATAGTMENTLLAWYSLRASDVPPRDNSVTKYYTAILNFPNCAGTVEITTEMVLSNGKAYHQRDEFQFDDTTTKNSDIAASNLSATSAGMGLTNYFNLYDGAVDGMTPGSIGVKLSQGLSSGGTQVPVRSNIMLKVFGVNAQLLRIVDSTSIA